MKIKTFLFLFLLLNISLEAREINEDGDFQLWLHQSFTRNLEKKKKTGSAHISNKFTPKIFEKSGLALFAEERWGGDGSTLYFFFIQTNYIIQIKKWLEVAPGYRQAFRRDFAKNRWRTIYEPMFYILMKHKYCKWDLSLRHQVQYRIFDHERPQWVYRLRPRIHFPFTLGKWQPYFYSEFFFVEHRGFQENRTALGLQFPINKCLSGEMEYMCRFLNRDISWLDQSIIRTVLQVKF